MTRYPQESAEDRDDDLPQESVPTNISLAKRQEPAPKKKNADERGREEEHEEDDQGPPDDS